MRKMKYQSRNKQLGILVAISATLILLLLALIISAGGKKAAGSRGGSQAPTQTAAKADAGSAAELREGMAEELGQISTYLGQLDTTVMENQESLDGINSFSEAVDSRFSALAETLADIDSLFVGYLDRFEEKNEDILVNFTTLQSGLAEARAEIRISQESIESLARANETASAERQAEIKKQFEAAAKSVAAVKERLVSSHESIMAMLDVLQLDNDGKHTEAMTLLAEAETRMGEMFTGQMEGLNDLLVRQDYGLQVKIDGQVEMLSGRMASLHDSIAVTRTGLTALLQDMESHGEERQEEIQAAFATVQESLAAISREFDDAYGDTKELLALVQETEAANHAELLGVLGDMEAGMKETNDSNLNNILSTMAKMQEDYSLSLAELTNGMGQGFADLGNSVGSQFSNLDSAVNSQFSNLDSAVNNQFSNLDSAVNNQFSNLDSTVNSQFSDLDSAVSNQFSHLDSAVNSQFSNLDAAVNSRFTNLDSAVNERFTNLDSAVNDRFSSLDSKVSGQLADLNTAIGSQISSLAATVNTGDSGLRDFITEGLNGVNSSMGSALGDVSQKLESVFTYVSDGKKLLASTLLTKGVTTNEDATFRQLADAILNIPQEITVGELPGEITYDYHYHSDHAGNLPHTDSMAVQGGCYTLPVYHAHGGGCYKTVNYHVHNDGCPGHPFWVDWNPAVPEGYWGWGYDCGDSPANASKKELNCPKNGSTVDGYQAGCGLADGQITGAHITYLK